MASLKAAPDYLVSHGLDRIISTASTVNVYEEEDISDTAPEFDMGFEVHNSSEVGKEFKNLWTLNLWSRKNVKGFDTISNSAYWQQHSSIDTQ